MLAKFLHCLGFDSPDEAIEFLVSGIATLPALLMLSGFMLTGALTLLALLILLMLFASLELPTVQAEARSDTGHDKRGPGPQP